MAEVIFLDIIHFHVNNRGGKKKHIDGGGRQKYIHGGTSERMMRDGGGVEASCRCT